MSFDPSPLRRARCERELSLTAIGARVGRDASQVGRYETGHAIPNAIVLAALIDALEVDPRDVFPDQSACVDSQRPRAGVHGARR